MIAICFIQDILRKNVLERRNKVALICENKRLTIPKSIFGWTIKKIKKLLTC
jgi:hypothetical protein